MPSSVSAIVPTFNRSAYLAETVEALLAQTRPLHEIIIWDDGSTDSTPDVTAALAEIPQIKTFRAENKGKSAALNAAMAQSTGDYIWICDDDDVARPYAAEKLGALLDDGEAGVAAGRHTRFSVSNGEKVFFDTGYWPDLRDGSIARHLLEDIFFFQNASLVRRACFDKVGPFREDLARSIDYEMFVRLATRFPIDLVDEIMFDQRKHDGARGPAAQQHAAAQSESVWLEADRTIFAALRPVLPVSFYAAMYETDDAELAGRAGLLQRGCIYARRCDWHAAFEDFEAAMRILPDAPLTGTERAIAQRAMAGKHGNAEFYAPPLNRQAAALRSLGAAGASLVNAFAKGSFWRAREAWNSGDRGLAARIATFCLPNGIRTHPQSRLPITERRILPQEAYTW